MNQLMKMFDGCELTIIDEGEEVFFLLKDVCNILELGQVAGVKRRLDEDVISNHPLQTRGGKQNMTFVNEDGLYDVVLDSRKPEAKKFRKWITSEVLPSIRKTGSYEVAQHSYMIDDPIKRAEKWIEERKAFEEIVQQQQLDAPYTQFGRIASKSDGSISVGAFAKMMYEKHNVQIGRNKLFAWLRDHGYLIKAGREKNSPKQIYIEQGLFEVKPSIVSTPDGDIERMTTLITGKGQFKLSQIIKGEQHETA